MTDEEFVILPSIPRVPTDPETRRKQIELLIRRNGYAAIAGCLTAEERVQYEPK